MKIKGDEGQCKPVVNTLEGPHGAFYMRNEEGAQLTLYFNPPWHRLGVILSKPSGESMEADFTTHELLNFTRSLTALLPTELLKVQKEPGSEKPSSRG